MGVNTTKLKGYVALAKEMIAWLETFPQAQDDTGYTPYHDAVYFLQGFVDSAEFIAKDLSWERTN